MIQSFCKKERVQNLFVRKKMIKIFWEKQSWKELILMEALPKLYLLDPTIQVLNAANSEHLKIKSFEKLAHSESETDDCGLLRNTFCIFTKLVVCCRDGRPPRGEPCKNDQNRGEVAGQNKGPNLNFLKKRKQVMEQLQHLTMPNLACQCQCQCNARESKK